MVSPFEEALKSCVGGGSLVVNLGSETRFSRYLVNYQDLFVEKQYYCLDIQPSDELDIHGDINHIPLCTNSVDTVLCISVLDHLERPDLAISEIQRILRRDGQALFKVPFLYSYHGTSQYKDYHRFTLDTIAALFGTFEEVRVQTSGPGYISIIVSMLTFAGRIPARIGYRLKNLIERWPHRDNWLILRQGLWETRLDILPKGFLNSTGYVIWVYRK